MSTRLMTGASASLGSLPVASATLSRTSCTARSRLSESLNWTKTTPEFSREKEWILSMPLMPATASSMGLTTWVSISPGPAPRYTVVTVTTGKVTSG